MSRNERGVGFSTPSFLRWFFRKGGPELRIQNAVDFRCASKRCPAVIKISARNALSYSMSHKRNCPGNQLLTFFNRSAKPPFVGSNPTRAFTLYVPSLGRLGGKYEGLARIKVATFPKVSTGERAMRKLLHFGQCGPYHSAVG